MVGVNYSCLSRCLIHACYRRCLTEMLPACVITRTGQSQTTAQYQILRGDLTPAPHAALKGPQHLVADVSVSVIPKPSEKIGGSSIRLGFEPAFDAGPHGFKRIAASPPMADGSWLRHMCRPDFPRSPRG